MKKIHETHIPVNRVEGTKGHADVFDIITGAVTAGVRTIAPSSNVPPPIHSHHEAQIIYIIQGSVTITNNNETLYLDPGDFVVLEPYEEHYLKTDDTKAKIFEVKYPPQE